MPHLSKITHPNTTVQTKLRFFQDYFNFAKSYFGSYNDLEIENPLFIVEKAINQIETNLEHCPKYLESYFSHPLFGKDSSYLNNYQSYSLFKPFLAAYRKAPKKTIWIANNPEFITSLKAFKKELDRKMFKSALESIISLLKCEHELTTHVEEIKFNTNILVSELFLKEISKKDLDKVFHIIISRDIEHFPFPSSIKTDAAKKAYMHKITFDQQLKGIYNILKGRPQKKYFLYRVIGFKTNPRFSFKYNRVTFYHPDNEKLKLIRNNFKPIDRFSDFFEEESMLVASVKVDYYSLELGGYEAFNLINDELKYLNHSVGANAYVKKYSYLYTSDYKTVGWNISTLERGHVLHEGIVERLNNNVFKQLKPKRNISSSHFLKYEHLYVDALTSHNMADFWNYLDALIPAKENNDKQIIDAVSSILIIAAEKDNRAILREYFINVINFVNNSAETLTISKERQIELNDQLWRKRLNLYDLSKEITHPFLSHMFNLYFKPYKGPRLSSIKDYYARILWELQAQRNAIVHSGYGNEKAMILLNKVVPILLGRLRKQLISEMNKSESSSFEEIIISLRKQSNELAVNG